MDKKGRELILYKKYRKLMNGLKKERQLLNFCRKNKLDVKNFRIQLKKRFKKEYEECIYGEIIDTHKGYKLRRIPNRQTNTTQTTITKRGKEIFMKLYDCIEEVGVWSNNFKTRKTIDIYVPDKKIGVELYWRSGENYKKLLSKINSYKPYFKLVIVALLKDSSFKRKNRSYYYIKQKLKIDKIPYIVVDIGKTPPLSESHLFPMELRK